MLSKLVAAGLTVLLGTSPGSATAQRILLPAAGYLLGGGSLQSDFYNGSIDFSGGTNSSLRIGGPSTAVFGLLVEGNRSGKWGLRLSAGFSKGNADYVEATQTRPPVSLQSVQLEVGVVYSVAQLGTEDSPMRLAIEYGPSVTQHYLKDLIWNGQSVPSVRTTVLGAHISGSLAWNPKPLGNSLAIILGIKATVSELRLGKLADRLAAAQGAGLSASLQESSSTMLVYFLGIGINL